MSFTLAELPDSPEYRMLHKRELELDASDSLVTTIVTYEEQTRGWLAYAAKSRQTAHQVAAYARLRKHLRTYLHFEVLDEPAALEFDRLRSLKLRVGTADLKIAAIAISRRAILLSRNLSDFKRIADLRAGDWTKQ
jgi:tRNA(fMet)-specific endonuclease VapC